ncbi:MAG: alpha/beta hydrolase [Myxococcota bacterium]
MWAILLVACVKPLPPTMVPADTLTYRTSDGWEAEVRHYPGEGPPVLLVHGMGANHYNWDYRPEVSLAHALQARGWDVWIPALRGDPGSLPPDRRARRGFSFSEFATLDLPAAVDAVLAATGEDQLFWVGHSMGGMLLYTAISDYPEKIAGGVAICSPSGFAHPFDAQLSLARSRWLFRGRGAVPAEAFGKATGGLGRANPLFRRVSNPDNLDFAVAKGLARHALVDMPHALAFEATGWVRAGELVDRAGEPWLRPNAVPLLVMGGAVDRVVAEPDVRATCDRFPDCEYRLLGTAGGFSADYGHVDAVLGKEAASEVYPVILDWLDRRRATAP